jgi:hypothetical protein
MESININPPDIKFRTKFTFKVLIEQKATIDDILTQFNISWKQFIQSDSNPEYFDNTGAKRRLFELYDIGFLEHYSTMLINVKKEKYTFRIQIVKPTTRIEGIDYNMKLDLITYIIEYAPMRFYEDTVAEAFFYDQSLGNNGRYLFIQCWDRDEVLIKSNLSLNKDRYLGISNKINTPIKYYRLNSEDKEFWIELYSVKDIDKPSVIPSREIKDDTGKIIKKEFLDDLFIETIFCFDANAII